MEEALASNREQASDIANLQDELRRIHSSVQVITNACNGENGEKSPDSWRFKLDIKSDPVESGDFGENSPKI